MSAEKTHRENTGVLFRNKRATHPDAPDLTGEAMIGDPARTCPHCGHHIAPERYRVASWEKTAKNNHDKYRTLAFNIPKDESEGTNG